MLGGAGFAVELQRFEYSAFPGRFATPILGLVSLGALVAAAALGVRGRPAAALALLAPVAIGVALATGWLVRYGVLRFPIARAESTNLVATRGGEPAIWIVAHLDSKSQPVPIGARALGVVGSIAAWTTAIALATAQLRGADAGVLWWIVLAVGVASGIPVALTTLGARSPGAVDNASGVVTALLVAASVPASLPIAVLLTSAEEMGLAGARAWAASRASGRAINFDGVDDRGALRLTSDGGVASRPLTAALLTAAAAERAPARAARLIPGVLLDGVALAEVGWGVVTVSRGDWKTVARIHTPRDDVSRIEGSGAMLAAAVVTRALEALLVT
ncbi:MAG: M28 family peptidase [Gemmatimonadaceae bacterium]